jgi:cell wall-associated NlpC family hydrolase
VRKHLVDGLATTAVALTLVAAVAVSPGWVAAADEGSGEAHPSRSDVRAARDAADGKAAEVAAVQARLASAQGRLRDTAIRVAQAEEAFNRARWNYREARRAQRAAERIHATTETQLGTMRDQYVDVVVSSYEMSPSLTAMAAILESDGITTVVDRTASLQNAQAAMDQVYDDYDAAALLAGVSSDQATEARLAADALREDTKQARAAARETQRAAAGEADAVAAERVDLIGELARLQGISVALAEERQEWLEAQATPTTPTPTPTPSAEPTPTQEPTKQPTKAPTTTPTLAPTPTPTPTPTPAPTPAPTAAPTPTPTPTATPAPTPTVVPTPTATPTTPPPAPAGGAAAAIAFARAQIGDPYQWGAAGPDRWDCSGLTMRAWQAGGISLPHYSAGQYDASTPIAEGDLQPGDLVFWGSSSSPSSIYHVALYTGGGMIVHAPRTGEDVAEVPIDYWISPNFFARP